MLDLRLFLPNTIAVATSSFKNSVLIKSFIGATAEPVVVVLRWLQNHLYYFRAPNHTYVMANIPHSCHIVSINIYCSWYDGCSPGRVAGQLGVRAGCVTHWPLPFISYSGSRSLSLQYYQCRHVKYLEHRVHIETLCIISQSCSDIIVCEHFQPNGAQNSFTLLF